MQRTLALVCFILAASGLLVLSSARANQVGGDFSLMDQEGDIFHLEKLRGQVVLLFFGYTYCPDICPTELSRLVLVKGQLGPMADRVSGIFVSVDPERDTPEVLKRYLGYFDPSFIGLTGSASEIQQVADQYKARFRKYQGDSGQYSMDHSANLYVIDKKGQLASVVPYGLPPQHVVNLVRELLVETE